MVDEQDHETGRLALERGLITQAQLDRARRALDEARAEGRQIFLGGLLVEKGFLTQAQIDDLLAPPAEGPKSTEIIEGYEIIQKLGEGGMGAVYLARQVASGRSVALKILPRRLSKNRTFLHRFIREAQLVGKLEHPNVVRGIDVGESRGYYYLAMEYVEGRTARDLIYEREKLPEAEALGLALQVARALEAAHALGIVHRDVKPENVLVGADGAAKLSDLGLARETGEDSGLTGSGMAVGTAHYISPEQASGQRDLDIRCDIYSLGASLYHMLAGRTLYAGDTAAVVMAKHLTVEPLPIREVNPAVSENCALLLAKMLAREREERYATPTELIRDIELVLGGKVPEAARSRITTVQAPAAAARARPPTRRTQAVSGARRAEREASGASPPLGRAPSLTTLLLIVGALLVAGVLVGVLLHSSSLPFVPETERDVPEHATETAPETAAVGPTQRYAVTFRQGAPVAALGIERYEGVLDTSLSPKDPNLAGPERGMGGGNSLCVGFHADKERRAVIRFDLARIPRTAKVEKALLSLYCRTGARGGALGVYRVTCPWAPSAKSMEWDTGASWTFASGSGAGRKRWDTPGGDFDAKTDWGRGANGLVCAPTAWKWRERITFDLTPLVRAWVSGKVRNHGLLLKPENWPERKSAFLHAADNEEAGTRPALEVVFTAPRPGGAAGPVPLASDASALQRRFKGKVSSYDPAARRATVIWDFPDKAQLGDFIVDIPRTVEFQKGAVKVTCFGVGQMRLPQFSGHSARVCMTYRIVKRRENRFMAVWFGRPVEEGLKGRFFFFADGTGFKLGTKLHPPGYRELFKEAPGRLPERGTLEVACEEGRVWAGVDGRRVIEAGTPIASNEVGAGVVVGGGGGLTYVIERLEVRGVLDESWLRKTSAPNG